MGIAITGGVMASLANIKAGKSDGTAGDVKLPPKIPTRFLLCVRSDRSAARIERELKEHSDMIEVVRNDNVGAARRADIVLLACKPYMVGGLLGEAGMADALKGTILASVCAGVEVADMEKALHGPDFEPSAPASQDGRCRVVRVMCNTAAMVRESMSVIATQEPPIPQDDDALLTWIFKQIGDVSHVPPAQMDVVTSLAGSGPAMFALVLEAAIDGGVAMGLPRVEAIRMATQTMRGTTGLVQSGEHPSILRENVCSPGGCTIGAIMSLEEGGVRGQVSRAVRQATVIASQLGQGVKNVNGPK